MSKLIGLTGALILAIVCAPLAAAQPVAEPKSAAASPAASVPFVLGPPPSDGPVVVKAGFELSELNEINDEEETFAFTGVLTLQWQDQRQAFDPAGGVTEKIYQGAFQFDEISPAWFP